LPQRKCEFLQKSNNEQEGKYQTKHDFGGYHVIFSGDFRQIPPVGESDHKLLYRKPGLWENAINHACVAIMLTNSHCFLKMIRNMEKY
jgi:hypothetical protein